VGSSSDRFVDELIVEGREVVCPRNDDQLQAGYFCAIAFADGAIPSRSPTMARIGGLVFRSASGVA
jgi:hypothetical protein